MVWVNIIKSLGIASFKSIYPKILTSSRVRGICLINKSYFSVIDKTTLASCIYIYISRGAPESEYKYAKYYLMQH